MNRPGLIGYKDVCKPWRPDTTIKNRPDRAGVKYGGRNLKSHKKSRKR